MDVNVAISALVQYGLSRELFAACDRSVMINQLLSVLQLDSYTPAEACKLCLEEILQGIQADAVNRGVCADDITSRDLLDAQVMGALTPPPEVVWEKFVVLYKESPAAATDWFYRFCQDTDYIRRYRIQKDVRWKMVTEYGILDITINLSKPEKDTGTIGATGDTGCADHPGWQNHRVIPLTVDGQPWYFQYSPYVSYHEHCIVFSSEPAPMTLDRDVFRILLDFTRQFPHYFLGFNGGLPMAGGNVSSHGYFQGGHYSFPLERACVEHKIRFEGFGDVRAGIVKWPMSVLRLTCADRDRLVDLADKILRAWRGYTDEEAFPFAGTGRESHNTLTPIARRRGEDYELDLVLCNTITNEKPPLGVFHPHAGRKPMEKETISLTEMMGLAVLPAKRKRELKELEETILAEAPIGEDLSRHAGWVNGLRETHIFTAENTAMILKMEVGRTFARVLEHAGVFKRDAKGEAAFNRFLSHVNQTAL